MRCALAILLLLATPALAQQDQTAFLAKALHALQQQRNAANDELVNTQAKLALALDEIAALKARIKELETNK
jgi:predicted  nucleic acid-binding Zn-ribbon protein